MMPLTSHSTIERLRRSTYALGAPLGETLGTEKTVTPGANWRTVPLPDVAYGGKRVYSQFASLMLAYLASLKGRPCYRNRAQTACEWILTLQQTPTRKDVLARHLEKGKGHYQPGSCQANMELSLLRAACRWGMYQECWEG